MKTTIFKSLVFALIIIFSTYIARNFLHTESLLSDSYSLNTFIQFFANLYAIMITFIVIENWNHFHLLEQLIEKEALNLKQLSETAHFFRDAKFTTKLNDNIRTYLETTLKDKFANHDNHSFHQIGDTINNIDFDDDHDAAVFNHMLTIYNDVATIRTERITNSATNIAPILQLIMFITSGIALLFFITLPFVSSTLSYFYSGSVGLIICLIVLPVYDLSTPFTGAIKVSTKPYSDTLKHLTTPAKTA